MNAWSHLPNAQHIDWVITSLKQHPDIWKGAPMAAWNAARDAAWDAAKGATRAATRAAAYDAARNAALDAALRAAWGATWNAAIDAAWDAFLALIAYDDCATLLDMPSEQLKTWAVLTEQPAAVLLRPAVIVRERISELNMA